jgi:hypothetical protein
MSDSKLKPTRWYYVMAILIPIFACLGTALIVCTNVPKLPGALEGMGINDLTQVIVPGSAEINFPKAGGYAVYYEYRSVMDGVSYIRNQYPPSINCHLTSKDTGAKIAPAADYVEGNIYSTDNQKRVGVLIMSIVIREPGVYIFACQYTDGRTSPEIILAVGPNIVWEFFNIAAKPLATVFCGGFVFVGALGVSLLIIGFVAFKRHRLKNS